VPAGLEAAGIGDKRPDGSSDDGANTGDGDQPPGIIITPDGRDDRLLEFLDLRL
jgi:hypothetical protein